MKKTKKKTSPRVDILKHNAHLDSQASARDALSMKLVNTLIQGTTSEGLTLNFIDRFFFLNEREGNWLTIATGKTKYEIEKATN